MTCNHLNGSEDGILTDGNDLDEKPEQSDQLNSENIN